MNHEFLEALIELCLKIPEKNPLGATSRLAVLIDLEMSRMESAGENITRETLLKRVNGALKEHNEAEERFRTILSGDNIHELDKLQNQLRDTFGKYFGKSYVDANPYFPLLNAVYEVEANNLPWSKIPDILSEELKMYQDQNKNGLLYQKHRNTLLEELILKLEPGDPALAIRKLIHLLWSLEVLTVKTKRIFYIEILIGEMERELKDKFI